MREEEGKRLGELLLQLREGREMAFKLGMEEGKRWREKEATEEELVELKDPRFGMDSYPDYLRGWIRKLEEEEEDFDETSFLEGFRKGVLATQKK